MIFIFRVLIGIPFFCVGFVAGELWAFLHAGFIKGRDSDINLPWKEYWR